jgi:3-isopropylmalate/(R)-2-methylmalate dehydratase small subunit
MSSATAAHGAVVGLGIAAVIAESFGRLFLSNCVSAGLWAITCPGILGLAESGDALEIDLESWQVRNLASGRTVMATPLPEFFREVTAAGGEKAISRRESPASGART